MSWQKHHESFAYFAQLFHASFLKAILESGSPQLPMQGTKSAFARGPGLHFQAETKTHNPRRLIQGLS